MTFEILGDASFPNTPVTFLVNGKVLIDAGNAIRPLGERIHRVADIVITHSHMDHIMELPLIVDLLVWSLGQRLTIWGNRQTVEVLREHVFNGLVWPKISEELVQFRVIEGSFSVDGVTFVPVPSYHTVETTGFFIGGKVFLSSDTGDHPGLWKAIEELEPEVVILDVSWPARMGEIARLSKHLSSDRALEGIKAFVGKNKRLLAYHLKPAFFTETYKEISPVMELAAPGMHFEWK